MVALAQPSETAAQARGAAVSSRQHRRMPVAMEAMAAAVAVEAAVALERLVPVAVLGVSVEALAGLCTEVMQPEVVMVWSSWSGKQ